MVTKILKLFILVGVLGIHTGCFQMSNDSGGESSNIGASSNSDYSGPKHGVIDLTPSKKFDASRYLSHDFDHLVINSEDSGAGSYAYSKRKLQISSDLHFPIKAGASYKVSLLKGSKIILSEKLK